MTVKTAIAATATLLFFIISSQHANAEPVEPTHLPAAVVKAGDAPAESVISPELRQIPVARGAMPLENPTSVFSHYGYAADGPFTAPPGATPSIFRKISATKTEPDKNTYLVLEGQTGPAPGYDYGTHFLFQGHEGGPRDWKGMPQGYLTRINLDADAAHRVTLMADKDIDGNALPTFDGSTWHPFAQRLLLTAELGKYGGVWSATVGFPSKVEDLSWAFGRGGYEGIQADSDGNLWIVEDTPGAKGSKGVAKQPNSFIYRFLPYDKADLTKGGKLQALQVLQTDGQPIAFHPEEPDRDILSAGMKSLHTYGTRLPARWITLNDTASSPHEPFDANQRAKERGATPFKRPENGVFRPGTGFKEFVFTETGDTNLDTEAGREYGGFGGLFSLTQTTPSAAEGEIRLILLGDAAHSGFDNITFWNGDIALVAEDAGDTLHAQRKAYDSLYAIDLTVDYGKPGAPEPRRIIAQGRDDAATADAPFYASSKIWHNDGDNEITGIHVSDGDPSTAGLFGAIIPTPLVRGWRFFYTHQHGDNVTYEITPTNSEAPTR
jgi:hypothetical protein